MCYLRLFLWQGPTLRLWYKTLDRVVKPTALLRPIQMMLADQALFAPFFLTVFWTTMSLLRRETFDQLQENFRQVGVRVSYRGLIDKGVNVIAVTFSRFGFYLHVLHKVPTMPWGFFLAAEVFLFELGYVVSGGTAFTQSCNQFKRVQFSITGSVKLTITVSIAMKIYTSKYLSSASFHFPEIATFNVNCHST